MADDVDDDEDTTLDDDDATEDALEDSLEDADAGEEDDDGDDEDSDPTDPLDPNAAELPETEFDLLFPVIPVEDDPSPPEEENLRLVDDLEDFAADEAEADEDFDDDPDEDPQEGWGAEVAMDYSSGELFGGEHGGDVHLLDGDDAVVEWAMKMLNTEPDTYAIYPTGFGAGVNDFLGMSGVPQATVFSEISRRIVEGLTVNDRIDRVEVENLRFDRRFEHNALLGTVSLWLDTDPEPISFEVSL